MKTFTQSILSKFGRHQPISDLLYEMLEGESVEYRRWEKIFSKAGVKTKKQDHRKLFCLHTYVAIVIKFLAYNFLTMLRKAPRKEGFESLGEMKDFCLNVERGEVFKELGVSNFCQSGVFMWYAEREWSYEFFRALNVLYQEAMRYSYEESTNFADEMKRFYEKVVSKELRHALGEHYTPSCVADYMVREQAKDLPDRYKAVDPTCGAGTFLVSLLRDKINRLGIKDVEVLTSEVIGMDINPIAVLQARFSYLLTLLPLLKEGRECDIPVYEGDATTPPEVLLSLSPFDFIVGNPPWVRWSALPEEYRNALKREAKVIFSRDYNYGGIDLNLSALITHKTISTLAKKDTLVAFILPRGVLKNKSYEGFRNWQFGLNRAVPIRIYVPEKNFFRSEEAVILVLKVV